MKINKKKILSISFLIQILFLVGYLLCLFRNYPEQTIGRKQLYGEQNENLKDFEVVGDGIRSTSGDPWIEFSLKQEENIKIIELDFSGVAAEGQWGCVWDMDTWEYNGYQLKNGKVFLSYDTVAANSKRQNLRFDLVESAEVYLQIDRLVINSRLGILHSVIEQYGKLLILLLLIEFVVMGVIEKHGNTEDRKGLKIERMVPFVAIGGFVTYIYHVWYLKTEAALNKWMFLSLVVVLLLLIEWISARKKKSCVHESLSIILYAILNFGIVEILSGCRYDFSNLVAGFWNIVLWVLIIAIFHLFTQSLKSAVIIPNMVAIILGMINHYFYQFRGNPFELSDLQMAGTAMTVISNYRLEIDSTIVFIFFVECMVICAWCLSYKGKNSENRRYVQAEVVAVCLALMGCFLNDPGVSYWNMNQSTKEYGYLNAFVKYARKDFSSSAPQGYSREWVEEILGRYETKKGEKQPNIIVIMNESFADLPTTYQFETDVDSMPFIHGLNENTIKGNMLVSVFGGSTANTEYEFMTGNSMAYFSAGSVPYMQYVKIQQESLTNELKNWGYQTGAFHPCNAGNYNRNKVYPLLGFDFTTFIEDDLLYQDTLRSYISDKSDMKNVIDIYEHRDKEKPFYMFNVTMQNHGGYSREHSEVDITVRPKNSELCETQLLEYLSLVKESDAAFEQLVQYFENEEEDTVIVMFGDHQPGLDESIYNSMEPGICGADASLEQKEKMYRVPFIIWANYDIEEENDVLISPNYLRAFLLEKAKMSMGCYDQFLMECQAQYPAINVMGYYDSNGNLHQIDEATDLLTEYQILQYGKVFDKNTLQNVYLQ